MVYLLSQDGMLCVNGLIMAYTSARREKRHWRFFSRPTLFCSCLRTRDIKMPSRLNQAVSLVDVVTFLYSAASSASSSSDLYCILVHLEPGKHHSHIPPKTP